MDPGIHKKATMAEPLVFVTDADPAADAAVCQIYESTYQIHCIFHISENLPKISNQSFTINMKALCTTFSCLITVYASRTFMNNSQNSQKNITKIGRASCRERV